MKLHYYAETDSLYIELKPTPGTETREVAEGVSVDLDAAGAGDMTAQTHIVDAITVNPDTVLSAMTIVIAADAIRGVKAAKSAFDVIQRNRLA